VPQVNKAKSGGKVKASPSIHEVEKFLNPPSHSRKDVPNASAGKPVAKSTKARTKASKKRCISKENPMRGLKKKSKVKVLSKSDARKRLKEYMLSENRPYTHNVLFDNLRGVIKKSMLPVILAELADENVLSKKAWKKTIVYWANQDNLPSVSSDEMAKMDERIKQLEKEKNGLGERNSIVSAELRRLEKEPTDVELKAKIEELTSKVKTKRIRVEKLTNGATLIDAKSYDKLGKEFLKYYKPYKKRRAGCIKLAEGITEHIKQKPKDWLSKNCDPDEDYGIDYKSYKVLYSEWKERLKK